ncbi:hypothetical protein ADUPG1_008266, partial [Aduncisulcus paluster]
MLDESKKLLTRIDDLRELDIQILATKQIYTFIEGFINARKKIEHIRLSINISRNLSKKTIKLFCQAAFEIKSILSSLSFDIVTVCSPRLVEKTDAIVSSFIQYALKTISFISSKFGSIFPPDFVFCSALLSPLCKDILEVYYLLVECSNILKAPKTFVAHSFCELLKIKILGDAFSSTAGDIGSIKWFIHSMDVIKRGYYELCSYLTSATFSATSCPIEWIHHFCWSIKEIIKDIVCIQFAVNMCFLLLPESHAMYYSKRHFPQFHRLLYRGNNYSSSPSSSRSPSSKSSVPQDDSVTQLHLSDRRLYMGLPQTGLRAHLLKIFQEQTPDLADTSLIATVPSPFASEAPVASLSTVKDARDPDSMYQTTDSEKDQ